MIQNHDFLYKVLRVRKRYKNRFNRLSVINVNYILYQLVFEPYKRDRFYHSPNSNPVLFFKILFLRPDQDNGQVQMDAKVRLAVEPIRINLDQDTAFHLVKYFTGKN